MVSVADALASTLSKSGVRRIYGMDSPEPFTRACMAQRLTVVTIRDERSAAAMADAEFRTTGRLAVCTAIQGPGVTNLITTLAEAKAAASAVIAIAKDTALSEEGRHPFQDFDEASVLAPVVKAWRRPQHPDEAVTALQELIEIAIGGRPGPVALIIPGDLLDAEVEIAPWQAPFGASPQPAWTWTSELSDSLRTARQPLIIAGELMRQSPYLASLAAKIGAPVAMTPLGHGSIDDSSEWSLGVVGAYTVGLPRGAQALAYARDADWLLILGSTFDAVDTDGWQFPADGAWVGWVSPSGMEPPQHTPIAARIIGNPRFSPEGDPPSISRMPPPPTEGLPLDWSAPAGVHPGALVALAAASAEATRSSLAADASFSSAWCLGLVGSRSEPPSLIAPRGLGGLGWSIPAAIGAALAQGHRAVAVAGDGAVGYSILELDTAVRVGAWVTVVVLDNALLGFQDHWERYLYGEPLNPRLGAIDYAALANAIGARSIRTSSEQDVREFLSISEREPGVYLLDVLTDGAIPGPVSWFMSATAGTH